ncbi:MAG: cobalamin biosynthesis protein CbiG, partial [Negativicutes bacterium]
MRCAVFVATAHGIELAGKLRQELEGTVDIFVKEGRDVPGKAYRYERLGDTVRTLFTQYDALIFCMAVGIVVRLIAPCLKSKLTDPAVVVVDERVHYAISLLSGHVGGANRLTERVAAILGAVSVITTATDVNHYLAPDALATELGLRPVPKPEIQTINGALLEEKTVAWYI